MSKPAKAIKCSDCETDLKALREYHYKVLSEVWDIVAKPDEDLCVGCLEKRLERKLIPDDFTNESINRPSQFKKSARLLNRLSRQIHIMKGE